MPDVRYLRNTTPEMGHPMTATLRERSIRRLYHRGDPATSGMAAEAAMDSGAIPSQRARVLAAVRAFPGKTAGELSVIADLGPVSVRRRLTDLKHDGLARQGDARECAHEGTTQCTWFAVGEPEQRRLL